jgi:ketosteroid isomerase-like protein
MDDTLTEAFNAHDLDRLMALFARDLEFYHDTGGRQSYDDVTSGFRGLFAANNGIERSLLPGSLEVYPIKDYGAIEIGEHRFCHQENGRTECGSVRFVHVWRKEADRWKITRVVSYGH